MENKHFPVTRSGVVDVLDFYMDEIQDRDKLSCAF